MKKLISKLANGLLVFTALGTVTTESWLAMHRPEIPAELLKK